MSECLFVSEDLDDPRCVVWQTLIIYVSDRLCMDNFDVILYLKHATFCHNLNFYDYVLKSLLVIHAELAEIIKYAVIALLIQLTQLLQRA